MFISINVEMPALFLVSKYFKVNNKNQGEFRIKVALLQSIIQTIPRKGYLQVIRARILSQIFSSQNVADCQDSKLRLGASTQPLCYSTDSSKQLAI